mgnify:CR=1 FL=1
MLRMPVVPGGSSGGAGSSSMEGGRPSESLAADSASAPQGAGLPLRETPRLPDTGSVGVSSPHPKSDSLPPAGGGGGGRGQTACRSR